MGGYVEAVGGYVVKWLALVILVAEVLAIPLLFAWYKLVTAIATHREAQAISVLKHCGQLEGDTDE